MREKTTLETVEDGCYASVEVADNWDDLRNSIIELGFAHLAMSASFNQGTKEIWGGMRGRDPISNLGTIARFAAYIYAGYNDPLTHEYAAALEQDREEARRMRAGEQ